MSKKVLVIGNGSREHCLAWKLSHSSNVSSVYVSPGNGGIKQCSGKISMIELNISNHEKVIEWCKENEIDLVVIGPEDPLSKGISDKLNSSRIPCFGPSQKASRIESDKAFAKNFMRKYNVPTASFENFTDNEKAKEYVRATGALVIKASGLAGGKGVIVAKSIDEACDAIDDIMLRKKFGKAGDEIVVEEYLEGDEVSIFALTDGVNHRILLPAQDHKRAYDNDQGPNTGGMGAYCPYPFLNDDQLDLIRENILQKTIDGMRQEGHPFVGLLYAGLMITPQGPKVIEFNCRFGDPETQSILCLLKSDLYEHFMSCLNGQVDSIKLEWDDRNAVGIVLASGGYPGPIVKNIEIHGLNILNQLNDVYVFFSGCMLNDQNILVTDGGRILTVVALDHSLKQAAIKARNAISMIKVEKSFYRHDIANKAIQRLEKQIDYKQSGVDIEAGNQLVEHIKQFARRTQRTGVMEQIGGFGALFDLKKLGMKDPILVSGTDGVGTKLKIAIDSGVLNTVGIDLVAMCVNDILVQGAEPLFFLDYFACSRLQVDRAADIIKGIADGCLQSNCALIGGETAEMPGMYAGEDFDLAGFAVGAVERDQILPRKETIAEGDVILGLTSSGLHSNGFSMVRKIMEINQVNFDDQFDERRKFHEILLTPTKIYVEALMPAIKSGKIKALAHITGGGLIENIPRVLPKELMADLDAMCWPMHEIFTWLKHAGNVSDHELQKTFNCGIGMVLIVDKNNVDSIKEQIQFKGEQCNLIGKVMPRVDRAVIVRNFSQAIERNASKIRVKRTERTKKRVAVLISGVGTNLKAIIDYVNRNAHKTCIDLALVVSNKSSAPGLQFAREAGLPVKIIVKKKIQTREEYEELLNAALEEENIQLICLAGFMQMLTENFVNRWLGRMINIHPSILPSFKGMNAYGQALEYGVKYTGCTVHFVTPEMDAGPIIAQAVVQINPNETLESLVERGKAVEHQTYPKALEMVASGKVTFTQSSN